MPLQHTERRNLRARPTIVPEGMPNMPTMNSSTLRTGRAACCIWRTNPTLVCILVPMVLITAGMFLAAAVMPHHAPAIASEAPHDLTPSPDMSAATLVDASARAHLGVMLGHGEDDIAYSGLRPRFQESPVSMGDEEVLQTQGDDADKTNDEAHYNPMDDLSSLLELCGFLALVWLGGVFLEPLNAAMVGEVLSGMATGPSGLNIAFDREVLDTIGLLGLAFLVLGGGLGIDRSALKQVGVKGGLIGVTGTIVPLGVAFAILILLGYGIEESLIGAACSASTGIGIATRMLKGAGELTTEIGKIISVAAIVDDVLSLILLSIITFSSNISSSENVAWIICRPIVASIGMVLAGWVLAYIVPKGMEHLGFLGAETKWEARLDRFGLSHHSVVLAILLLSTVGMMAASGYAGSTFLLGIFATGVAFASVPDIASIWSVCAVPSRWLASIFFASIGTMIPLDKMFSGRGFGLGVVFTLGAIASKYAASVYMLCGPQPPGGTPSKYGRYLDMSVVGWAMVGRGEIGLMMAEVARKEGHMSDELFAVVVWGLLLSTIISPFAFGSYLKARHEERRKTDSDLECPATIEEPN